MAIGISEIAALHVLQICQQSLRDYTAGELNDFVAAFPPPAEAVKMMGIPIGNLPILFEDVDVMGLAAIIQQFLEKGDTPFPVFYMPTDRMQRWADGEGAKAFLAYLHKMGLDLQLTVGGAATWLRGHWVILCDARIRFMEGVTREQLEFITLALPPMDV